MNDTPRGDAQSVVDRLQSSLTEMHAALAKTVAALNAPITIVEPDSSLPPDERSMARAEAQAQARRQQGSPELWKMAALRTRLEAEHGAAVDELAVVAALAGVTVDRAALTAPFEHFSNLLRSRGSDSTYARRLQAIPARVDTLARASAHLIDVARKLGCRLIADEPRPPRETQPLLPAAKAKPWWAADGFKLESVYAQLRLEVDDAIAGLDDATDDHAVAALLPGFAAADIAHCRDEKVHPLDHWVASEIADLVDAELSEILAREPQRNRFRLKNGAEVTDDTLQRTAVSRYRSGIAQSAKPADTPAKAIAQLHAGCDVLATAFARALAAHTARIGALKIDDAIADPEEAREAAELDAMEARGYPELFDSVLLRARVEEEQTAALNRLIGFAAQSRAGVAVDRAVLTAPHASFGHLLHPGQRHASRAKWLQEMLERTIPAARAHLTQLASRLGVELQHGRDWLACRKVPWSATAETDTWRQVKSDLRTLDRDAVREILGVDEADLRGLELQRDELQQTSGWRTCPGEAHVADVWAIRDIEWTPRTLDQVFHDGDYGSGANPDRQYRVAGASDVIDPREIQARAARQIRAALETLGRTSAGAKTDVPLAPTKSAPLHSSDFTSVTHGGESYRFSKRQAAAIALLWREWARGTPTIAEETLAEELDPNSERDPKRFRLRDIFKGKTKGKNGKHRAQMHPAWGTMIIVAEGIARLSFAEKGISPS